MNLQFAGGLLSLALLLASGGAPQESPQPPAYSIEIKEESAMPRLALRIGDQTFFAQLEDSDTTQALLERLPLTLTMEELNGNEKYVYLEDPLPIHSFQPGSILPGDFLLYESDCLVLFYDALPATPYSYTALGRIENPEGLAEALGSSSVTVQFSAE